MRFFHAPQQMGCDNRTAAFYRFYIVNLYPQCWSNLTDCLAHQLSKGCRRILAAHHHRPNPYRLGTWPKGNWNHRQQRGKHHPGCVNSSGADLPHWKTSSLSFIRPFTRKRFIMGASYRSTCSTIHRQCQPSHRSLKRLPPTLPAQKTGFGWILTGPIKTVKNTIFNVCSTSISLS